MKYHLIFFLLLLTASCDQINKSLEETRNPVSHESGGGQENILSRHLQKTPSSGSGAESGHTLIFEDSAKLDAIWQTLLDLPQFKGKDPMLYRNMHISTIQGGSIHVNIQNPDTTENVDTYKYAGGKWQTPVPVQITGSTDQVSFFIPLREVRFATASKIFRTANEKLKTIPGAAPVDFIYFSTITIKAFHKQDAKWYLSLKGTRNMYHLEFDLDGNLKNERKL